MRGFSFVELTITLVISISLATVAFPIFSESRRDAQLLAFASEMTAQLSMARQYAQLSGHSVTISFEEEGPYLFRCTSGDSLLASRQKSTRYGGHLPKLVLPQVALTHPTTGQPLARAIRSTHGNRIIFGQRGSSSATLVFSMDPTRIFCIVLSGSTGRFRAYLFKDQQWLDFQ